MNRRIIPTLLAALALLAPAVSATAEGKPRAVPLAPIEEFDIIPKGQVISHTFEIKNEGDAPLELTDVRPACGCTVARYDKTIAPGEVGKVSVKIKTDNFAGPIAKSVAVFTNDSENPKLQLVVKAQVKPYIQVLPGYVRYNYVQGEEVQPISQTVWAEDGSDVNVVGVQPPHDYVKVSFREATDEERKEKSTGRQWRVIVSIDKDSPVGPLTDYVVVQLDHPKQKVAKIPVSGFVRPRQHITPQEVDFGKLDNLPLRRTFHFSNFITDPIELTSIDTGFEAITAEVTPSSRETEKGYRFKLLLTIGPEMPKGAFDSEIKIHTTDEQNPVITLPIKGIIL